jgi:hypothetical protein
MPAEQIGMDECGEPWGEPGFGQDIDADIAEYAEHLHEQWLVRPKLSVTKINEKKYKLCFEYSSRKRKIEITGDSFEKVLTKFLKEHAEEMFGTEFEVQK